MTYGGGWCLVILHGVHALMTRHSDDDKSTYFVKRLHIVCRSTTPHDVICQHASTVGCFASILAGDCASMEVRLVTFSLTILSECS